MITFVLLGNEITRVPTVGTMLYVERSAPNPSALCYRRIEGAMKAETEYFSILDGGEDILFDNFEEDTIKLCEKMNKSGHNIGLAKAKAPGCPEGRYGSHAVVCRTSAFKELKLPPSGLFHFETMVYTMLLETGQTRHDAIVYEWMPSPNGAHGWEDTPKARENGFRWATGRPLATFQ